MYDHSREPFAKEHLPEELPVHSVVSLLKIELQDQAPKLSDPEFMSEFVEGQNPFIKASTLDECRFTLINSSMS
jgi:hypothetical protein